MKINELLVESRQSEQLDEGPFGTAVGKLAGGVAKGVGAVAGGVAGMGKAFKKGYQSGKATVAGDPDPNAKPDDPAAGAAPAATEPVGGATEQPAAGDVNKAGPAGTAAAKPLQGAAKIAADKTAAATAGQDQAAAGQTMYAQVKANIDKLDKKGKQRILQLLQKSMAAPAGGAEAGGTTTKDQAGAGAMGAMAQQLGGGKPAAEPANTMANTPVSRTNTAKPGNPNAAPAAAPAAEPTAAAPAAEPTAAAEPAAPAAPAPKRTGGKVKGQVSMTPNAVRKREKRLGKQQPQGPDQAEIDASRDRLMGNFSDSIIRHKQRMVAESFARGELSLFRKK